MEEIKKELDDALAILEGVRPIRRKALGSYQRIFYGAPGTGKSHEIKRLTKGESVIRTTFHPDSDYSTFVGAYKPLMSDEDVKVVPVVLGKAGIEFKENKGTYQETRIVYRFVMQAFLKAYLGAWKKYSDADGDNANPQYLIIEEINRGNCAQIFGDLFQLLDRGNNGFSEYPIEADADLQKEIKRAFEDNEGDFGLTNNINVEGEVEDYISNRNKTISEDIQDGYVLLLPPNLYILATMNTSDQSLFPIDSAFKRRWDWIYIPIKDHKDENYKIDIDGTRYNWWGFLEKINCVIGETTSSEDKKLGYFFVKTDDGIIKEDKFVSKVLFYLWNDVFKNYGFDNDIFSRGDNKKFSFSDFFLNDGSPATSVVNEFLVKLDTTINKEKSFVDEASDGAPSSFMVKYNGEDIEGPSARGKYIDLMKRIVSDMGGEQVSKCIGAHLTKEPDFSSTRNFIPVDSEWYLVTNAGIDLMKGNVRKLKESLGIDVVLE